MAGIFRRATGSDDIETTGFGDAAATFRPVLSAARDGLAKALRYTRHFWSGLDISRKLELSFGLLVVLSIVLSVLVFAQSRRMAEAARMNAASDLLINNLDNMRFATLQSEAAIRDVAFRGDTTAAKRIRRYQTVHARLGSRARAVLVRDGSAMLSDFDAYRTALSAYDDEVAAMHLGSDHRALAERLRDFAHERADAARAREVAERFAIIRHRAEDWSQFTDDAGLSASFRTSLFIVSSAFVTVTFGLGLMRFIEHAITGPIRDMTTTMQVLAAGDLTVAVPAAGRPDEIGRMAMAVEVFRLDALDRARLQREAAANVAAIEAQRAHHDAERADTATRLADVVRALANASGQLAKGDLTGNLEVPFAAAYETLRNDFNFALVQLRAMIEQVALNSQAIERGTRDLSEGSSELARRAGSRAQELRASAVTLNETTQAIETTAANVEDVGSRLNFVRADAERSVRVVVETRASMARIGSASDEIARITELIDGIAAKSNLLALNAVIEAARAGPDGRGFAVVANEVRLLARQSGEAASEIRSLVAEANEQIRRGADFVLETGETLQRIGDQIIEIDDIAQSAAASSRTQAAALGAVNDLFLELDETTREDATLILNSDAAVQILTEKTQRMGILVSQFTTD